MFYPRWPRRRRSVGDSNSAEARSRDRRVLRRKHRTTPASRRRELLLESLEQRQLLAVMVQFAGELGSGSAEYPYVSGTQEGRLVHDGVPSVTGAVKPFPGIFTATGDRAYDQFGFVNYSESATEVAVQVNSAPATGSLFAVAYNGFDADNIDEQYLGDSGEVLELNNSLISFGLDVGPMDSIDLVLHEVEPSVNAGDAYEVTVTWAISDLVIDGTDGDDTLLVTSTGDGEGTFQLNGGPVYSFDQLTSFRFNGFGGDDTLILDFQAGHPLPDGNIHFDGGESVTGDRLRLVGPGIAGSPFESINHTYLDSDSGQVHLVSPTQHAWVSYDNAEAVWDDLDAKERSFLLADVDETVNLDQPNAGRTRIESSEGASTEFRNPTVSIWINSGLGIDNINIRGLDLVLEDGLRISDLDNENTVSIDDAAINITTGSLDITARDVFVNEEIHVDGSLGIGSTGDGEIILDVATLSSGLSQTYSQPVVLRQDVTLRETGGNVSFLHSIDGPYELTVENSSVGFGNFLVGDIGNTAPLAAFRSLSNGVTLSESITATGAIFIGGQYSLPTSPDPSVLIQSTDGGTIEFESSVGPNFAVHSGSLSTYTTGQTRFNSDITNLVSLDIVTGGPFVVDTPVRIDGEITIRVVDTTGDQDSLVITDSGSLVSRSGSISLLAGDDLSIEPNGLVDAFGSISIEVDSMLDDPDPFGSTVTIAGTIISDGSATIAGGADADTFSITPQAQSVLSIDGRDPTIAPGDSLEIDAAGQSISLTPTSITVGTQQPIVYTHIESVRLLNVGPVVVDGDDGDNTLRVLRGATADSVLFSLDAGAFFEVQSASLTFNGAGGNDRLIADYESDGVFTTSLYFNGNGQTGGPGDQLDILGTFDTQTLNYTGVSEGGKDGDVLLELGEISAQVFYTGLEPINAGNANETILNLPAALSNNATLRNHLLAGNIEIVDNGASFEDTVIPNPTNSLTVNLGNAGDTLEVLTLDPNYAASLIINGGDSDVDNVQMTNVDLINTPGRGLWVTEVETLGITGGMIAQNTAAIGGGVLIENSTSANPTVATLSDVTIANNTATGAGGAGLHNNGAVLSVLNSIITDNDAVAAGANGAGIFTSGGVLNVVDTSIQRNATNGSGGGIFASDGVTTNLLRSDLTENTAGLSGGGLFSSLAGLVSVADSSIQQNVASGNAIGEGGGGLFLASGTLSINGSTLLNNIADGTSGSGGAILNRGVLTIDSSTLDGNRANRFGGGVESSSGTTVTLNNVTMSTNNAGVSPAVANPGQGGGLHASGDANVTILGGSILANHAATEGGGVWNDAGTLSITGTLIQANRASGDLANQGGGGIYNQSGTVDLDSVQLSLNEADGVSGSGGGILSQAGTLLVGASLLTSNSANRAGGAIEIIDGGATITSSTISQNDANGLGAFATTPNPGQGGGVNLSGSAVVSLLTSTLANNLARTAGGGLWNSAMGTFNINGSSILSNVAEVADAGLSPSGGGGIFNDGGSLAIGANNTIADNIALDPDGAATNDDGGGGIFNRGGTVTILGPNTQFSGNRADNGMGSGGALMNVAGNVTISDVRFASNQAAFSGGAIENVGGNLLLANSVIEDNTAGVNGGGLSARSTSTTVVNASLIQRNTAQQEGGGLWNGDASQMTINNATIVDNQANATANANRDQGGGGVFNIDATLSINDSLFENNFATANLGSGGGVMTVGGTVVINGGSVSSNQVGRSGGGLRNLNGNLTLNNVLAELNTAEINGGGIQATGPASWTDINGGTFRNNVAEQEGGGLWNGVGEMRINAATIQTNTANAANNAGNDQGGGGVFNDEGTLSIENATITNNLATANDGDGGGVMNVNGTLVISGGSVSSNQAGRNGGGLRNLNGNVTLNDVVVELNTAVVNGGGLFVTGPASVTMLTGGTFGNNVAGHEGGGLWNGVGTMAIDSTIVNANQANSADNAGNDQGGGGVYNSNGTLTLTNATVLNNQAVTNRGSGGGIMTVGGVASIIGGSVRGNRAGGTGGAVASVGGMVTIRDVVIGGPALSDGNIATMNGGGVFNDSGSLTIEDAAITNNLATASGADGGGVMTVGGTVAITGGTVASNRAGRSGGGMRNSDGNVTLLNVLMEMNTAELNGGGLNASGPTSVTAVTDGTFQQNAAGQEGGGLWNGIGTMAVIGAVISENRASGDQSDQGGGGAFNHGGVLNASGASIVNNRADGTSGSGGGIFNGNAGTLNVSNSTVAENQANRAGGGIESTAGTTTTLVNANLVGNLAGAAPSVANPGNGGGLHITGNGSANISGGTINDNHAASEGGGLWNGSGLTTVTGTMIDSNRADGVAANQAGGGVFNSTGTLSLDGVLLTNNVANIGLARGGGGFNDQGTMNVTNSTITGNDLCGLAYVRASGTVTNNVFAANVGEALCTLLGTDGDDVIRVTSTTIQINADLFTYDTTLGPISIDAGAGNDTFNVQSTAAANPFTLIGSTGNDLFNISSDAPNNQGNLDQILGAVTLAGDSNGNVSANAELTVKGNTAGENLVIGDRLIVSDRASAANNQFVLDATTFTRTGASPAAPIAFTTVETLTFITGSGNDTLTVNNTPANASVSIITHEGDDTIEVENTGAESVVRVDLGAGADTAYIRGGGADGGLEINGGAGNDQFELSSTGALIALRALGGSGDDLFAIVGTSSVTATELYGDAMVATGNDGADTFDFGHTLVQVGNDSIGSLSGLLGAVCVFGGGGESAPLTREVSARRSPNTSETLSRTVMQSDTIVFSDAAANSGHTYALSPETIGRTGITTVTYEEIEAIKIRSGQFDDTVNVINTVDETYLDVITNGGSDTVALQTTGVRSITEIRTGLISMPVGVVNDNDTVTIETTGNDSILNVDTDADGIFGSAPNVTSDQDQVSILERGTRSGIRVATGRDQDTITIGDTVATTQPLTGSRSVISVAAGDGDDTFQVNEVFLETVIDLQGGAGNDTFNLIASGSDAIGSLGRLNNDPINAQQQDSVARTREIFLDGGSNSPDTRTVNEGVALNASNFAVEQTVAGVEIGDTVNLIGGSASTDLDLRYVITGPGQGVLATTLPSVDANNRAQIGNEVFETRGIENVNVVVGQGNDLMTVSSLIPFGITLTDQVVRFDGGGGTNQFEVFGTDFDDRITIGQWDGSSTSPFEVAGVDYIRVDGRDGGDQIVNNTAAISVLDGGLGNDILLGGARGDVLTGGAGADALFGRGGNDILFADQDFGDDQRIPADGDVLDGGDQDNLNPGDICVQVGLDLVRNCELLGDGGAQKDVLTWLRVVLVPLDSLSFAADDPRLSPFDPIAVSPIPLLTTTEPNSLSPGVNAGSSEQVSLAEGENPFDVNGDGKVTALDALVVINSLNGKQSFASSGEFEPSSGDELSPLRTDVNRDGQITALDALLVINQLASSAVSISDGEWIDTPAAVHGAVDGYFESLGKADEATIDESLLELGRLF